MMKNLIKIIYFSFLPLWSVAQNVLPETFLISTDTVAEFKIDRKFWRVWDDSLGNTDFKIVSSPAFANRFRQFDTTKQSDFSVKTFWYHVRLKNTLNKAVEMGIPAEGMETDIYFADSTLQWQHLKTGWSYNKSNRDGYKMLFIATLTLQPFQEIIIYTRLHSTIRTLIPNKLTFDVMPAYLQKSRDIKNKLTYTSDFDNIVNAILIGIILLAFFINFTFYRATKEKEYLYFSLFLLSFGLNSFIGQYADLVFGYGFNIAIYFVIYLTLISWFFSLMLFVRYFFRTQIFLPKWDKFLKFYNYFIVVIWVVLIWMNFIPINQFLFDRITDSLIVFVYLFLDFLFLTIFLVLLNKKIKINNRLLATVPIFFFYGPVLSVQFYYGMLDKYYKVKNPAFIQWINNWSSLITLIGLLWMILFFSWLLFKRYQSIQEKLTEEIIDKERMEKEKEAEKNLLISQQNERLEKEVAERTRELQHSLDNLKATQSQLIQSEKMASLGELTAGIAHEIQNPLNFINNFSEVNKELLIELKDEIAKGNTNEVNSLVNDLIANEEKINHHGNRADAIVKGMLQHSRSSSGVKVPTDINALGDEYLRLAYHGLRAKDKFFNATMKTDFDKTIGNINIIQQDIGRVILNLITNAFYVVDEKKKLGFEGYDPTVTVSTKKVGDKVLISVKDNGNGIPQKILDKIFQPFFTTKPSGQGTGLGLSLSYDIVNAHGGELKVQTKEGEGTEFIISLPVV
jgi:signal transduction histidine kinase